MKDEFVDILDEAGNTTGKVMMKSKAHSKGLWHGGTHLWIYNDKAQILLQRRAPTKVVWPNVWDVAVAGHIPAGKSARETVIEEAEEELGLKIDPKDITYLADESLSDQMPGGWMHNVFVRIYLTKLDVDLNQLKLEEAETSEARWVGIDELEKELADPVKSKEFRTGKSKEIFHLAINEIRKRLKSG